MPNPKDEIVKNITPAEETVGKERDRLLRLVQDDIARREQPTKLFRNESLTTYAEVSQMQFVGYREKPSWKKDYQYNVWDQITRDKVMAIISKAGGLYQAEFFNTNKRLAKHSETITTTLNAFYTDSTRRLNEKDKNKDTMLSGLISPKAILFEGWRHQPRIIRDIEERDEYGRVTKTSERKVIHYSGPTSELIPVTDFVPGSLKIRDIQEQPRLSWAPKMSMEEFKRKFPAYKYPEAKDVQPGGILMENDLSEYLVRSDLKDNEVEVVHVFEKWDDRYSIIANGILLGGIDKPMPFAHKDYPFVWGGFEPLSPHFIYDMPLCIKLLDMQDVSNEVLSLTLDMVWRALNEVILVSGGDDINSDVLYGGGLVDVDNAQNFQKLEFGSNFGFQSASAIMERARRSIESSSVDATQQGQAGSRPATAREILVAREAAIEIASLFLGNMEAMERDKARLRVKNQLDRYHLPKEWEDRIGEDGSKTAIPIFREITARDTRVDGGKKGTVNIYVTNQPRTREELNKVNNENNKELTQTIDVTPEFIRMIDFDVEIVGNSSVKRSRAQDIAEARAFFADANAAPDVLNRRYAATEYVKALGQKEDEAVVPEQTAQPQMAGAIPQQGMPGKTPMPQDNVGAVLNQEI